MMEFIPLYEGMLIHQIVTAEIQIDHISLFCKKKTNYPIFLHIRMARLPNLSGRV